MFQRSRQNKGFTLLELLLVICILLVVSALAFPNFRYSYQNLLLRSSSHQVSLMMQRAQIRAMADGHDIRMVLSENKDSVYLEEKDSTKAGFLRLEGELKPSLNISAFKIQENGFPVIFSPDGGISQADALICDKKKCFLLSTREYRNSVRLSEWVEQ